jgi:hypothetical protein
LAGSCDELKRLDAVILEQNDSVTLCSFGEYEVSLERRTGILTITNQLYKKYIAKPTDSPVRG